MEHGRRRFSVIYLKSIGFDLNTAQRGLYVVFKELTRAPNNVHAHLLLLGQVFVFKYNLGDVDDGVQGSQILMGSSLDKSLMILILVLQLLMPGDVADISNDEELAVHITKFPRLDNDLKKHSFINIISAISKLVSKCVIIQQVVFLSLPVFPQNLPYTLKLCFLANERLIH